jgi:hypothetical protein
VDIASAATTNIGAANSLNVRITGTTTITSLGTVANGIRRYLRFAAALTLTHNATSLILPGGANITTAAGDTAIAISLGSGNWVVVNYMPASGYVRPGAATASGLTLATARLLGRLAAGTGAIEEIPIANPVAAFSIGINRATEQATTSGVSIDFTGIPNGVRRVTVLFDRVSTNGASPIMVQLGISTGIEATGYTASGSYAGGSNLAGLGIYTTGFAFGISGTFGASQLYTGRLQLDLFNVNNNSFVGNGFISSDTAGGFSNFTSGRKALAGVLDRLRITTVNGTDTFDNGAAIIMWEF